MTRFRRLLLYAAIIPATTGAQSTRPASVETRIPAVIPGTPAGAALTAWLDAFNSGDSSRMSAYTRTWEASLDPGATFVFRQQPGGGFDLVRITRSEARHLEFILRDRRNGMAGYGAIDMSPGDPAHVTSRVLTPLGPDTSFAPLRLDDVSRARVVEGAAAALDSFYVFPDVATRMGDSTRARLARGTYDSYDMAPGFALRLDHDLAVLAHDKHLHVRYSSRPLSPQRPADATDPPPAPDAAARNRARMEAMNCGFRTAEQLDGNVGYLKFDVLGDPDACERTAAAALTFLAGTRALILDLRENGGGSAQMAQLLASYLFDRRTQLSAVWTRRSGRTEEFWTRDTVSGRRFGGMKPVYVLTSHATCSAAEALAYDLQAQHRATIVGETTGGGAHPVRSRRIDEHFMITVPYARAINPVTHANWEGVGVTPDVKAPAADALATALRLIGEPKWP
jgi:hypothetical protein